MTPLTAAGALCGDGRHKIGSAHEAGLHSEALRLTRLTVEAWCARRLSEERTARGFEIKKTVLKEELAQALGCTVRQLDAYGHDVPLTLAKAVILCRATGDDRLLNWFALQLDAAAVFLPPAEKIAELGRLNQDLLESMADFTEFQRAALTLQHQHLGDEEYSSILADGLKSIRQTLKLILEADLAAHGRLREPLLSRLRSSSAQSTTVPTGVPS